MRAFIYDDDKTIINVVEADESFLDSVFPDHWVNADDYGWLDIGGSLNPPPPPPEPTPAELREYEYGTRQCIEWYGEMITINHANELWLYYTAEGRDMTALAEEIHAQKEIIRQEFPDEATRKTVDEVLEIMRGGK